MDGWETIIFLLLIIIILPIVFSFFWHFKVRGEMKVQDEEVIRTRPPKTLSAFFLGFALIVLFGGTAALIYCCITDSENATVAGVIALSACVVAFSAIGFIGYAWMRFNYVVADENGILVCRLFRKKRYYRYGEIGCFIDETNLGMVGSLKGYDKNNAKIFTVEAVHIGTSAVVQRLREHEVPEKR